MRITCEVTLVSRQLASSSHRQPRPVRSSLAIGRAAPNKPDTFLQLCTATNKQGTKYKVLHNLDGVFTKFAGEGKFTMRLKEPAVDLVVKTDAVQAKVFLGILKACVTGKGLDKLQLSSLAAVKQSQLIKPKTTLRIFSKKEYPITVGFPYSLEQLTVSHCELNRVERRMLALTRLKSLDLSDNVISELPRGLAAMTNLTELILPSNRLSHLHPDIFDGRIATTLRKLNLEYNSLEYLPRSFSLLSNLYEANLCSNKLRRLPVSISRLTSLKLMNVCDNNLDSLSAGLLQISLDALHIAQNPFDLREPGEQYSSLTPVLSLKELAARRCLAHSQLRRQFPELPATLQQDLRYHLLCCNCQRAIVYASSLVAVKQQDGWYRQLATTMQFDRSPDQLLIAIFCSSHCAGDYTHTSRRLLKHNRRRQVGA